MGQVSALPFVINKQNKGELKILSNGIIKKIKMEEKMLIKTD